MEKINESKQITAAYDDALRYLDNDIIGGVKNAMGETKGKSADDLMYELIAFSFKMDTAVAAIAFVYGVTEQQVHDDLRALKAGE